MTANLWGDFSKLQAKKTPKWYLEQQAQFLTQGTEGVLIGDIESNTTTAGDFRHVFLIKVPSLNNYKFNLMTITHPIFLYPTEMYYPNLRRDNLRCDTEEEFVNELTDALKSEEIQSVLVNLFSQAS